MIRNNTVISLLVGGFHPFCIELRGLIGHSVCACIMTERKELEGWEPVFSTLTFDGRYGKKV